MRTVDLVQYLSAHGSVPAAELSRVFDASVRTVRAHVHEANVVLEGIASIYFSRGSRGYRLRVTDAPSFNAWLERASVLAGSLHRSAQDERVAYLLDSLLARTDWITIADLAAVLYVSPQSISSDLKQVEEKLAPFGLTLVKRPRYGVRVEGTEMARRLCLASLVSHTLAENGRLSGGMGEHLDELVAMVSETIEQIVRETGFNISSFAFQNLVIHVVVALGRIREQALVPLDDAHLATIRTTAEYPVAARIAEAIGAHAGVTIPESEVAYIAIHLAGKKTLSAIAGADVVAAAGADDVASDELDDEAPVIPEEIWPLVNDMLERVWESFRFDFRDDLELHMNLARHLVPLVTRLEYHLRMENPLLSDIKTRFPLAYAMGVEASSVLAERFPGAMSEEEVGYIALAFALALDRLKTAAPKKNVLVVCASGVGTTRLLKQSILRQFGDRIGAMRVCDVLHVADQDFSEIDYVFTTVPIEVAVPVPVQEIHLFLDEDDMRSIDELISRPGRSTDFINHLFLEQLFVAHPTGDAPEDVVRALAQRVVDVTGMDPALVDLAIERERIAPTAFGNQIALPHPVRPLNAATRVCVGLLDEPLTWGGKQVQVVMLVAIGTEDPEALDFFFTGVARLLSDEQVIDRLRTERSFAALIDAFSNAVARGPR